MNAALSTQPTLPDPEWFTSWFDSAHYHRLYAHRDDAEAKVFITPLQIPCLQELRRHRPGSVGGKPSRGETERTFEPSVHPSGHAAAIQNAEVRRHPQSVHELWSGGSVAHKAPRNSRAAAAMAATLADAISSVLTGRFEKVPNPQSGFRNRRSAG